VAQSLSSQGLRTILLWVVNKWIPQLRFSPECFHELFGFGWKMMAGVLIDTIWKELYQEYARRVICIWEITSGLSKVSFKCRTNMIVCSLLPIGIP
jgi:hypothetical protein